MRDFQYQLISYKLTTNSLRHKWDSKVSEKCQLCGSQTETINHLLWECIKVTKLWKAFRRWIEHVCKIRFKLTNEIVILNNYTGPAQNFINICILITKQYVYMKKCVKEDLKFIQISTKIYKMYKDEEFIAKKRMKLPKHYKKWHPYITYM